MSSKVYRCNYCEFRLYDQLKRKSWKLTDAQQFQLRPDRMYSKIFHHTAKSTGKQEDKATCGAQTLNR